MVGTARRARARTRAHTEERNLSLTRILNGCAEARTVGTHYSTTHPPPLSQNSTSSSCSFFSFSFSYLRPRRSRVSLSRSFASRAPFPPLSHFSVAGSSGSHHLRSPSRPLSLSLSAPCAPRARARAALRSCFSRVFVYCTRACARVCARACIRALTRIHIYTSYVKHTRVASSFHSISRFILLPYSADLSPFFFFFFFVPPRSVTPACNGRPRRRILLISWHATLSPCSAFISLFTGFIHL